MSEFFCGDFGKSGQTSQNSYWEKLFFQPYRTVRTKSGHLEEPVSCFLVYHSWQIWVYKLVWGLLEFGSAVLHFSDRGWWFWQSNKNKQDKHKLLQSKIPLLYHSLPTKVLFRHWEPRFVWFLFCYCNPLDGTHGENMVLQKYYLPLYIFVSIFLVPGRSRL